MKLDWWRWEAKWRRTSFEAMEMEIDDGRRLRYEYRWTEMNARSVGGPEEGAYDAAEYDHLLQKSSALGVTHKNGTSSTRYAHQSHPRLPSNLFYISDQRQYQRPVPASPYPSPPPTR